MPQSVSSAEFERARATVYDLLSAIFDGDMAVLHRAMEDGAFDRLATTLSLDVDVAVLTAAEHDEESLHSGYDNLFAVPGPHYVPPFASAHVTDPSEDFDSDSTYNESGDAGELYGDPAREMSALYDRVGFRPDRGDGIPDHLAASFEFVAALADGAVLRSDGDDVQTDDDLMALQREVLEHLEWLEAFADAVAEADSNEGVFGALAAFANAFVAWDRSQLNASTA